MLVFFVGAGLVVRYTISYVLAFVCGVLWCVLHAFWVREHHMPRSDPEKSVTLRGYITSIPTQTPNKTQFQFSVERLNHQHVQSMMLLSCYQHCPVVRVGEYREIEAKVRQARSLSNPGSFDYSQFLSARHIHWTGTIIHFKKTLSSHARSMDVITHVRDTLAQQLKQRGLDEQTLGIVSALTLGLTTHISSTLWDLFRHTGTTHLMVISGSHIVLVSGLVYALTRGLWSRWSRLCLMIPAQKVAGLMGLFAAMIYTLMAGFGVPAQRALISYFFLILRFFWNRPLSAMQAWRYALFSVVMMEPHAVLLPGFYLSFMAVAILIFMNQRVKWPAFFQTLMLQMACLLGLMPLTLFWFSYGSVNGFFANLIAIPWVSFIIVPFSLLQVIVSSSTHVSWLATFLTLMIQGLVHYLQWIERWSGLNITISMDDAMHVIAMILAMMLWVMIPVKRLMPLSGLLLLLSFFPQHVRLSPGEARVDVLDVGQGLALVVRTQHHTLLYDTGDQLYRGRDLGEMVIVPYLKTQRVHDLDLIIVSHPDRDHRGGLRSIEKSFSVKQLIVNDPAFYHRGVSCHSYPDWTWDGVHFKFFPLHNASKSRNNHCCILKISNTIGQVLLVGDIEQVSEQELIQRYGHHLASSVLVVPHHGSDTSSSLAFLKTVHPEYAIMSYGLHNRYHFPHKKTIDRYTQLGIPWYSTVNCGMTSVLLTSHALKHEPICYRK